MLLLSSPVSSAAVILGFFYLAIASYIIINAFFLHRQNFNEFIAKLPTRQEIELIILSLIPYIHSSIQEHTSEISLRQITANRYQQYIAASHIYREQFPKVSTHILIPLLHFPIVSIIAAIVTKQRKMSIYRSLFGSSIMGIMAIFFWYFQFQLLLGLSISYLIIISLRSRLNNDITSEICESMRIFLAKITHHAGSQKNELQAKIQRTEKLHFAKK